MLAGFVGFAVISKVPNTLHTPLMSGTNAIHGIVRARCAGGARQRLAHPSLAMRIILFVAMVFGTLNVIGGFLVTDRMLGHVQGQEAATGQGATRRRAEPMNYLVTSCYIVAFALFIYGLMGLTGPEDRGARQLDRRARAWASRWSRR